MPIFHTGFLEEIKIKTFKICSKVNYKSLKILFQKLIKITSLVLIILLFWSMFVFFKFSCLLWHDSGFLQTFFNPGVICTFELGFVLSKKILSGILIQLKLYSELTMTYYFHFIPRNEFSMGKNYKYTNNDLNIFMDCECSTAK